MLNGGEIVQGLAGAWRIVMRDGEARRYFNLTFDGVRRSFWALGLSLPIVFFTTTSLWRLAREIDPEDSADFGPFAFVQIGGTVLYWAAYLLAMIAIARQLKLGQQFAAYVVTFNWGTLFTSALFALPLMLYSLGFTGAKFSMMLTLPALGVLAWYRWQIAREVLGAAPTAAVAILLFDLTLGLVLDQGLGWLVFSSGGVQ